MPGRADVVLIHGDEVFLVDRDARAWLSRARLAAMSDLDVEVIDPPARVEAIQRAVTAVPFLAAERSVLLRDPPQLAERGRRGTESADALGAAVASCAPTTALCVAVHARVGERSPLLSAVRDLGARIIEHPRATRRADVRARVERLAAERSVRLPRGAVDHLVAVSGGEMGVVDAELAKLAAFAAANDGRLTSEDVRVLVAGAEQLETWDLLDRLLGGSPGRGVDALEALLGGGATVPYLTSILAGQLRELLLAHEAIAVGAGDPGRLASALGGMPPWRAERLVRWSRRTDADTVERWLRALQTLESGTRLGLVADDTAGLRATLLRAAHDLTGTQRTG